MKKKKQSYLNRLYRSLLWLTNNEPTSKAEVGFDIFFFITMTLILIIGTIGFIRAGEWYWASIIWIEYFWAFDALRHNRTYIK